MRPKGYQPKRRVKDAYEWESMDGNTPLEKMLNAYLTTHFILSRDVPADECLAEARKIIEIVYAYGDSSDPGAGDSMTMADWLSESGPKEVNTDTVCTNSP